MDSKPKSYVLKDKQYVECLTCRKYFPKEALAKHLWSHAYEKYASIRPERQTGRFKQLFKLLPAQYKSPNDSKDEEKLCQRKHFYSLYPQKKLEKTATVTVDNDDDEVPPLEPIPQLIPIFSETNDSKEGNLRECSVSQSISSPPRKSYSLENLAESPHENSPTNNEDVLKSTQITEEVSKENEESEEISEIRAPVKLSLRDYATKGKLKINRKNDEIDESLDLRIDETHNSTENREVPTLASPCLDSSKSSDDLPDDTPKGNDILQSNNQEAVKNNHDDGAEYEIDNVESMDTEEFEISNNNTDEEKKIKYTPTEMTMCDPIEISDEDDVALDQVVKRRVEKTRNLNGTVITSNPANVFISTDSTTHLVSSQLATDPKPTSQSEGLRLKNNENQFKQHKYPESPSTQISNGPSKTLQSNKKFRYVSFDYDYIPIRNPAQKTSHDCSGV